MYRRLSFFNSVPIQPFNDINIVQDIIRLKGQPLNLPPQKLD